MYTGVIEGVGPRYCPSIEDKIHRFAGKDSHQIFIEPEGLDTHEVYPQGVSTSLPFDVQLALVRSVRGLENVFWRLWTVRTGAVNRDGVPSRRTTCTFSVDAWANVSAGIPKVTNPSRAARHTACARAWT